MAAGVDLEIDGFSQKSISIIQRDTIDSEEFKCQPSIWHSEKLVPQEQSPTLI